MKVKLHNVGIISDCEVEFIPGINLIVGSSGSGKSTLMRTIHSIAQNEFSDSDISFGHNTMTINIENEGNHIEYSRSVKAHGDKCYYKVNGETYVKLGRTPLPVVADTLRIGDVNIGGEDVNFNFNLQFSSPFLILGNQSTLYNVLTYRSSFDISSITDYYNADVKSNASDIITNTKLKESLESNLQSLKEQEKALSPIEQLYSDYIEYKHKSSLLTEIKDLYNKLVQRREIKNNLSKIDSIICKVSAAINISRTCSEINNLNELRKVETDLETKAERLELITNSYKTAMHLLQDLLQVNRSLSLIKQREVADYNLTILDSKINSCRTLLEKESLIVNISRQKIFLLESSKCNTIISILSKLRESNFISQIRDLIEVNDKLYSLKKNSDAINDIECKKTKIHKELSSFSVCPLCGSHINV